MDMSNYRVVKIEERKGQDREDWKCVRSGVPMPTRDTVRARYVSVWEAGQIAAEGTLSEVLAYLSFRHIEVRR